MNRKREFVEPLCLDKTKSGVEINIPHVFARYLTQGARDALRFFYRSYMLNNAVLFVSAPTFSANVLEILFVDCVSSYFPSERPILFVVPNDKLEYWKELFNKWTIDPAKDVCEHGHRRPKQPFFLMTVAEFAYAGRCSWDIVVIDTMVRDTINMSRHYLKCLTARLFIVTTEVTVHERILKSLYHLVMPSKFSFEKAEHVCHFTEEVITTYTNKKTKNKDPTGVKVKSSQKRPSDNGDRSFREILKELNNTNINYSTIVDKFITTTRYQNIYEIPNRSAVAIDTSSESESDHGDTEVNGLGDGQKGDGDSEDGERSVSEARGESSAGITASNSNLVVANVEAHNENTANGNQSLYEQILCRYF